MSVDWVQIGPCRLACGDALEILPTLEAGSVDAVVTDPPYGISYRPDYGNRRLPNGGWMRRTTAPAVIGDEKPFDPKPILGVCDVAILWGANHFKARLPEGGRWLVWDKRCGKVPPRCQSDVELAWCSIDGVERIFRHLWDGFVKESERGEPRIHPTQKPVELMKWCLELLELPRGAVVLDPFAGSFTTALACMQLGLGFIGIEISPEHFEAACERIKKAVEDQKFFGSDMPTQIESRSFLEEMR